MTCAGAGRRGSPPTRPSRSTSGGWRRRSDGLPVPVLDGPPESVEEGLVEACVAAFRDTYERCWDTHTRPYDGIPELLDALAGRRLGLSVPSNKSDYFTRRCAGRYLGRWPMAAVLGQRQGVPRKPDPAGALEIAGRLGIPAGRF